MLFDDDFEVFLANTEESRQLHYSLRYQVYCQEMQFEDSAEFDNQMEIDDLDASSVHFIVRSKSSKEWIGAIRFIVAELRDLPTYKLLANGSLHQRRMIKGVWASGAKVGLEISRMCILGSCRKAGGSLSETGSGFLSARRHPEVLLGLMRLAYAYCLKNQIDICLFTITKPLARIMRNFELNFKQAGEEVEHRGLRAPHYTDIPNFLGNIQAKSSHSYDMFLRDSAYSLFEPKLPEFIPAALCQDQRSLMSSRLIFDDVMGRLRSLATSCARGAVAV